MLKETMIFATGSAVGAGIAYYITKKHYTKLYDKESAALKEHYKKREASLMNKEKPDISEIVKLNIVEVSADVEEETESENLSDEEIPENNDISDTDDEDLEEAESIIEEEGYSFPENKRQIFADREIKDHPYLIDESDYDTFHEYQKDWLTLYSDGVVCDDRFDVYDTGPLIPKSELEKLKRSKINVLYIRDDLNKKDYELTYDLRTYYSMSGIDYAHYE